MPEDIPSPLPLNRTKFRWVVCALLLFSTAINYIDRQVIGLLKPVLQGEFGFDERDYASIVFSFQAAYSIGLLFAGWRWQLARDRYPLFAGMPHHGESVDQRAFLLRSPVYGNSHGMASRPWRR